MKKRTIVPGYSKVCQRIEQLLRKPDSQVKPDQKVSLANILRNTLRNGRLHRELSHTADELRTNIRNLIPAPVETVEG